MLLFWSALTVDGRVVRLGRWEGGGVGKVPSLLKGEGYRVSPKFYLFVFHVNQGHEDTG